MQDYQDIFENVLEIALKKWRILVEKLLSDSSKKYSRLIQRKDQAKETSYSSLFIKHQMLTNLIIPIIISLRLNSVIDKDSQHGWCHS